MRRLWENFFSTSYALVFHLRSVSLKKKAYLIEKGVDLNIKQTLVQWYNSTAEGNLLEKSCTTLLLPPLSRTLGLQSDHSTISDLLFVQGVQPALLDSLGHWISLLLLAVKGAPTTWESGGRWFMSEGQILATQLYPVTAELSEMSPFPMTKMLQERRILLLPLIPIPVLGSENTAERDSRAGVCASWSRARPHRAEGM